MAGADINSLSQHPKFNLVAVADVDTRKFAGVKQKFPGVRVYQDWRELLEKEGDKIDSVNVSTPDHMHGPIGMEALALGKHVYGQKPMTQNLAECRAVQLRAREKGVMTQMGIQISSAFTERLAVACVRNGGIGKVKEVHTFSNKAWGDMGAVPDRKDNVPEGLSWDGWLGVAAMRPYLEGYYHPGNWRKRRDFGTGTLGDMGCHIFSGWYRALDLTAPLSVKSTGPAANQNNWSVNARIEYVFPATKQTESDTVKVTWTDGNVRPPDEVMAMVGGKAPGQGSIIIGTEGVLLAPHMSTPRVFKNGEASRYAFPKLEARNHYGEFVDACLNGGEKPSANFDYAGPLTESVLLGCVSTLFPNEELKWESESLKFSNSEAATANVRRDYRDGWAVKGV